MKVLHINQTDIIGGAGIAAYRLHLGLRARGVDSKLLVATSSSGSDHVSVISRKPYLEHALGKVTSRLGLNYLNIVSSGSMIDHPFHRDADVLNLHNLHGGYFNYRALPKVTRGKPAVFTLHDMWSFTGHCAYSFDCDRWQTGCGQCPYPETYPSITRDATALEWRLKDRIYERCDLHVVTPSRWLCRLADGSMLGRFQVHHIPNGIDLAVFRPLDTRQSRSELGIPQQAAVLLHAAASLLDTRKGADLVLNALARLPESVKRDVVLVVMGRGGGFLEEETGIRVMDLGYVESEDVKAAAYSAADLLIFPTRADNLPLILQESLACGTPMVSFNVGGVPDMVRPGATGYLAEAENQDDFAEGIIRLLDDSALRERMGIRCREIAQEEYDIGMIARKYQDLYNEILNK